MSHGKGRALAGAHEHERPNVAAELRELLADARAAGLGFDRAWADALGAIGLD